MVCVHEILDDLVEKAISANWIESCFFRVIFNDFFYMVLVLTKVDLAISPLHHPFDVFDGGIISGLIWTWLEKHASCTISTSFYNSLM